MSTSEWNWASKVDEDGQKNGRRKQILTAENGRETWTADNDRYR